MNSVAVQQTWKVNSMEAQLGIKKKALFGQSAQGMCQNSKEENQFAALEIQNTW